MGLIKGGFLRLFQTFLYAIVFCCAAIILGIFSYFLAVLADHNLHIKKDWEAVEGIAGVIVIYTGFAVLLTCCLAGKTFFSFIGLVMDLLCMGALIGVAVMTRSGSHSCSGNVNTPLGSGLSNTDIAGNNLGLACRLNKACFAVSIIGAAILLFTALMQIVIVRQSKKDNRYGPSPSNNYTSGPAQQKFWQRKSKPVTEKDAELGAAGAGTGLVVDAPDMRPSHDTAYTGSTVAAPTGGLAKKSVEQPPVHGEHAPHVGWNPHTQGSAPHGDYYGPPRAAADVPFVESTVPAQAGTARNF